MFSHLFSRLESSWSWCPTPHVELFHPLQQFVSGPPCMHMRMYLHITCTYSMRKMLAFTCYKPEGLRLSFVAVRVWRTWLFALACAPIHTRARTHARHACKYVARSCSLPRVEKSVKAKHITVHAEMFDSDAPTGTEKGAQTPSLNTSICKDGHKHLHSRTNMWMICACKYTYEYLRINMHTARILTDCCMQDLISCGQKAIARQFE